MACLDHTPALNLSQGPKIALLVTQAVTRTIAINLSWTLEAFGTSKENLCLKSSYFSSYYFGYYLGKQTLVQLLLFTSLVYPKVENKSNKQH